MHLLPAGRGMFVLLVVHTAWPRAAVHDTEVDKVAAAKCGPSVLLRNAGLACVSGRARQPGRHQCIPERDRSLCWLPLECCWQQRVVFCRLCWGQLQLSGTHVGVHCASAVQVVAWGCDTITHLINEIMQTEGVVFEQNDD